MSLQTFEQSITGGDVSMPVAIDFTGKQYFVVDVDSNGNAVLPAADGVPCIGIMQTAPNGSLYPGAAGSVRTLGVSKAVASGAIAAGAQVAAVNGGKVKTAVQGTAAAGSNPVNGSNVLGRALTAAATDGDLISILLQPQGVVPSVAA